MGGCGGVSTVQALSLDGGGRENPAYPAVESQRSEAKEPGRCGWWPENMGTPNGKNWVLAIDKPPFLRILASWVP